MPCMGPAPITEGQKQRAFEFVMDALTREYHLCLDYRGPTKNRLFGESRNEVLAALKKAIGEVLYQDACEGF